MSPHFLKGGGRRIFCPPHFFFKSGHSKTGMEDIFKFHHVLTFIFSVLIISHVEYKSFVFIIVKLLLFIFTIPVSWCEFICADVCRLAYSANILCTVCKGVASSEKVGGDTLPNSMLTIKKKAQCFS